jgi:hypothetical protein
MNLALRVTFATLAVGLSFMQSPANASLITRQFVISGSDVQGANLPAPFDPFDVTVTITWNPAVDSGGTKGITLNSINSGFVLGSPIAFEYDATADYIVFENATGDFYIQLHSPDQASGSQFISSFQYTQSGNDYYPQTKTVSFTDLPTVSEPPTLALLAFGLAMLLFLGRRRGRLRHAAA